MYCLGLIINDEYSGRCEVLSRNYRQSRSVESMDRGWNEAAASSWLCVKGRIRC